MFPDTGIRSRNLTCLSQEGYRWNEDLPDCIGNLKTKTEMKLFMRLNLKICLDIKHFNNKSSSVHHIIRDQKVSKNATEPEAGELTNYSLTYGIKNEWMKLRKCTQLLWLLDLIVPTSIIAGLIFGNLLVLAGVIHCRRRNR